MKFAPAPFFDDITSAPPDGTTVWLRAEDGIRIRFSIWPNGSKGTVLLFNGRTEYIEKYGQVATRFSRLGYAVASCDWRGQGLSDRLCPTPGLGHVDSFDEYQRDARTVRQALKEFGAPTPVFLVAHSMGGNIGYRSLLDGMDFQAALLTGPMWGIKLSPFAHSLASLVSSAAIRLGFGQRFVFGSDHRNYVQTANPNRNALTSDPLTFNMLKAQLERHPEISTGGPSFGWLNAALRECAELCASTPPNIPVATFMGTNESVVDRKAIISVHDRWPSARLEYFSKGQHELLMEVPEIRDSVFKKMGEFFDSCV